MSKNAENPITAKRRALKVAEACERVGCSRATYYRYVSQGVLPAPRLIGRLRRVDGEALERMLERVFA